MSTTKKQNHASSNISQVFLLVSLLLVIISSILSPSQAWTIPMVLTGRAADTRLSESPSSSSPYVKLFSSKPDATNESSSCLPSRRQVFQDCTKTAALLLIAAGSSSPLPAIADDEGASSFLFERNQEKNVSYKIQIPPSLKQGQKPVKTHLDEVNFVSETIKGYQMGITVDPVRINSLQEFGTPEQVAARVVTAEVNRDGIFEVTLLQDPYQSADDGYILEYLSVGKRGNKHLINKILINNNLLYVLTAQAKEDVYKENKELQEEMMASVNSFRV